MPYPSVRQKAIIAASGHYVLRAASALLVVGRVLSNTPLVEAAGAAASLFVRAVGQDDPAGAAVGAAAGGTGVSVRTTALPRMMKLMVANEEDVCEVGICVGSSRPPYADAELISTLF